MVRLVFRPYTQVRRTICTSVSLRLPPEFPLASPCSSIVHHLSGPNRYALARTSISEPAGCCRRLATSRSASIHFHSANEFPTRSLAYMLDSLVRVSRRVNDNHFVRIANTTVSRPPTSGTDTREHRTVVHQTHGTASNATG